MFGTELQDLEMLLGIREQVMVGYRNDVGVQHDACRVCRVCRVPCAVCRSAAYLLVLVVCA